MSKLKVTSTLDLASYIVNQNPELKADQIELGYTTFLELYKLE